MDYYKIRLKLSKSILPKFKEEELQWFAVKKLVKEGKGEIIVLEKSDDEFDKPAGLPEFPEWNIKLKTDLYFDFSKLLTDDEASDSQKIFAKLFEELEQSNVLEYSYENESGRFESWAYFDNSDFAEAEMIDKKNPGDGTKQTPEQIDMFKKKRKK